MFAIMSSCHTDHHHVASSPNQTRSVEQLQPANSFANIVVKFGLRGKGNVVFSSSFLESKNKLLLRKYGNEKLLSHATLALAWLLKDTFETQFFFAIIFEPISSYCYFDLSAIVVRKFTEAYIGNYCKSTLFSI